MTLHSNLGSCAGCGKWRPREVYWTRTRSSSALLCDECFKNPPDHVAKFIVPDRPDLEGGQGVCFLCDPQGQKIYTPMTEHLVEQHSDWMDEHGEELRDAPIIDDEPGGAEPS